VKVGIVWWVGFAQIFIIFFLELAIYLGACPQLSERSDEDFYPPDTTYFSLLTTKQIKIWLLEE
jgi:hypothetical protein